VQEEGVNVRIVVIFSGLILVTLKSSNTATSQNVVRQARLPLRYGGLLRKKTEPTFAALRMFSVFRSGGRSIPGTGGTGQNPRMRYKITHPGKQRKSSALMVS
jgi:hypothetical protein